MTEHVILIVGSGGVGRTTAVETLLGDESATAVGASSGAVDFGQVELDSGDLVRVYGVPPRGRYDFMWQVLKRRAVGVLALVSASSASPVEELLAVVDEFAELAARGGLVVGVTHMDGGAVTVPDEVQQALAVRFADTVTPVLTLDPRVRSQVVTVLSVLAASVGGRELVED